MNKCFFVPFFSEMIQDDIGNIYEGREFVIEFMLK